MSKSCPVAIILVSSGSRGDRILFKYPYIFESDVQSPSHNTPRNPYALGKAESDLPRKESRASSSAASLAGYSDEILSTILATKGDLCGKKFELKIDNIRFVGHPTLVQDVNTKWRTESTASESPTMILFNLVFVLQGYSNPSLIQCYYDLSRRLGVALRHEERRCQYLTQQAQAMLAVHDEAAALPEDASLSPSPYQIMLNRILLCQHLKEVYDGLCMRGLVCLKINNWIEVSYCLPQKVHNVDNMNIEASVLEKSLGAIRPYHALLLLQGEDQLLQSLPADCSPSLVRFIKIISPLKSLQQLAQDCDLALSQVFNLVGHLVYWGKATVLYPLCKSNLYILSPSAKTNTNSNLVIKFREQFPHRFLPEVLSHFSLPTPLGEHQESLWDEAQCDQEQIEAELVKMVIWLLQYRFLVQLHIYVFLIPTDKPGSTEGTEVLSPSSSASKLTDKNGVENEAAATLVVSGGSDDNASVDTYSTELGGSEVPATPDVRARWRRLLAEQELSPEEVDSVMALPAANNDEDLRLFARLCQYFRGKHHLEEIMYFENVSRSQLHTILDKFKDVLVRCTHQDAATITYSQFL